ncbi:hypothetical protein [Micromonospora radicis]|uniref:hypothetical protein n=1 Tax=Micromonospora radicis TaxID=1894971 RepID=UPI00131407DF|nr:hypothetical protein [Micromonospora radicis]
MTMDPLLPTDDVVERTHVLARTAAAHPRRSVAAQSDHLRRRADRFAEVVAVMPVPA